MHVEEMLAREAIRYTISRYTYAVDRNRYSELLEVFTPDGVMIFGNQLRLEGRDAIVAAMTAGAEQRNSLDPNYFQRHILGLPIINIVSNNSARALTYIMVASEVGFDHSGVYIDDFAKLGERWLLAKRYGNLEWGHANSRFAKYLNPAATPKHMLDIGFGVCESRAGA